MKDLISRALHDGQISEDEFKLILDDFEKYGKMKDEIRAKKSAITDDKKKKLIQQGKAEAMDTLQKNIKSGDQGIERKQTRAMREEHVLEFDLTYYPILLATFCVTMVMYKLVLPTLSQKLSTSYCALSDADQKEWNMRHGSSLHALVVGTMCLYTLLYDDVVYNDPVWADRPLIRLSCAILTGYVAADSFTMLMETEQNMESVMYYCHHASAAFAYYYVFSYGVLSYFANFRIMAEFSTPFVNMRWFLDKINYDRTSWLFITNGVVMTFVFVSARVFSMPKYWYTIFTYLGSEEFEPLDHIVTVMIVSCFVLDILNIKWSIRMLKGAHKVVLAKLDKNRNELQEARQKEKYL